MLNGWISYKIPLMDLINSYHRNTINIIQPFSVLFAEGLRKQLLFSPVHWSPEVFCGEHITYKTI